MSGAAGGEPVRGIGARLRAARERCGLSVLQAAERLHADSRILEALEAEDFTALGAEVYVRGHLRRYAEAVGESPAQLQELLSGSVHAARPDLTRIPHPVPARRSSWLLLPALLAVVGLAVLGLLAWLRSLPVPAGKPVATEVATPPDAQPRSAPAPATAAAGSAAAFAGGQTQLDLHFAALSWVKISDADGRQLLSGLFARGSTRDVSGRAPLRVVLGNAPAVDLQVNGRPVATAGLVHRNGTAHLLIDGSGQASAASARLASGN